MRSSVAITLIVCGTVLMVAPYIHNGISQRQVTEAMVAIGKSVNLNASMPRHAESACMLGGVLMIAAGAVGGSRGKMD